MLYCLCYLLSFLPLRVLYFISNLLYLLIYYIAGYRKKVVAKNLIYAFPNKTNQQRNQIAKDFYQQVCDLLLEHIKALTITPKHLLKRVILRDIETLEKFYQKGQSIILVAGHFGNWEWIANALALQTSYTICAGYQPLHDKSIDNIVCHIRRRFERKAMPMTGLFRYIRSYKGPPQAITFLMDQAPLHKRNSYVTTFLRQPTNVALTAAKLAQKSDHPIFYIEINRIKRGSYTARPILVTETPAQLSPQTIVEDYTRKLEANILRHPSLWLWSHRRWKR